jgi:hypothetical protein
MKTLFAAIALMAFGQAAQAAETATAPLVLNDMQMDQVTAGAFTWDGATSTLYDHYGNAFNHDPARQVHRS